MPSGLTHESSYTYHDTFSGNTLLSTQTTLTSNVHTIQSVENFATKERSVTMANGENTTWRFDAYGNLSGVETEGFYPAAYTYDAQGRLLLSSINNERNSSYSYDFRGNLASSSDALGCVSSYGYDERGRLTSITYPNTHRTLFTYDANGNRKTLTTPTDAINNWDYNGVNKPTLWQSPLSTETLYSYDKKRRLVRIERPSGKTLTHTYTNGHKVETNTTERTYNFTYACGNKPLHVNTGEGESITYGYDGDLPTGIAQRGLVNQDINYTYNSDFLPNTVTYGGVSESMSYDANNRLVSKGSVTVEYNLTSMTLNDNSFSKTLHVNPYGELQSVSDTIKGKKGYSQTIISRDLNGRILSMSERVGNRIYRHTYAYDTMGRLVTADTTSGIPFMIFFDGLPITGLKDKETRSQSYMYDANGNRVSTTLNGTTTTRTHTLGDQLESIGDDLYAYDEDGQLSSKITDEGTTHYHYGTMGELRSVIQPDGTTIEYLHNANNQRVAKKVNGEITEKYLWQDLTTLLATYDKDNNLIERYYYANQRMPYKMTHYGVTYYLSYNHLGSLRAVSDSSGAIVREIDYDAYGQIVNDTNTSLQISFGFAGGLYDPDTKLTRFGYRDYQAETGKWTAKDPIGFNGGDTNLYGYVLGDPVNFVDPEGLSFWPWNEDDTNEESCSQDDNKTLTDCVNDLENAKNRCLITNNGLNAYLCYKTAELRFLKCSKGKY